MWSVDQDQEKVHNVNELCKDMVIHIWALGRNIDKTNYFLQLIYIYRDLLREAVESKSERGEQLNALMKEGKLVPMVCYLIFCI